MKNSLTPDYLSSLVPQSVGSTSSYHLRNAMNLTTLHANSQLYYNSFLPSAIRDWNDLPNETRNAVSIASFKQKLNENTYIPPKYYLTGKRIGQIYHARLRTKCSALRQHLFSKNIIDDPFCACGAVEDTRHFLISCNLYNIQRQEMFNNILPICQPTYNTLLYGNIELSIMANKEIFHAVQEYLIKSKRFE